MRVVFYCGKCGKKLITTDEHKGKIAKCTGCGAKVPIPTSNLDKPQIRLFCPGCNSKMRAWTDEAGEEMRCPKCGRIFELPFIEEEPEPERKPAARKINAASKPRSVEELRKLAEEARGDTRAIEVAVAPQERVKRPKKRAAAPVKPSVAPLREKPTGGKKKEEEPVLSSELEDAIKKINFDAWKEEITKDEDEEEEEIIEGGGSHAGIIIGFIVALLAVVGALVYFFVLRK